MKTELEQQTATKRRLTIEASPDELKPIYETTVKRLAAEVKMPGFRKGKVPKAVLESKLGREYIRQEVLKDAVPVLYAQAARAQSVDAITYPDIEVGDYEEDGSLKFTATVEVRPEINLPQYKGIQLERPSVEPTDEEVEDQLERLRERFGTLEVVGRNASTGDFVTIDLRGYKHDVQIEEATAEQFLYLIGSEALVPELDTELEGKRAGDILKFNAVLPERFGPPHGGQEVTFQVIVKEVQARKLPPLDDEFAKTASEFDTLDELRQELRERLRSLKEAESEIELRNKLVHDLIERTEIELPSSMVAGETEARLARLIRDLERSSITLEDFLKANAKSEEELVETYRRSAEHAVAAELILDAIAEAEGLDVSEEELDKEIDVLAERSETDPDELAKELSSSGRVGLLAGDILRRKTLELLIEQASISDTGASE